MSTIAGETLCKGRQLGLNDADLSDLVRKAQDYQGYLNKLSAAVKAGQHERADLLTSRILNMPNAKLTALVRIHPASPITLEKLWKRVGELDPFNPIPESVIRSWEEKYDGSFRPITKFKWRRKALQRLCLDILRVRLPAYPFDYMERGAGGIDGATKKLIDGMNGDDFQYVVVADIRDCYGSIDKERVAALVPLPSAVTRNVVLVGDDVTFDLETGVNRNSGDEKATKGKVTGAYPHIQVSHTYPNSYDRRGLPQGAPTSQIIVQRACLDPTLSATSFSDRVVLFGDDIAVLARDETEAAAILQELRSRLETCPAGRLVLGLGEIKSKYQRIDFTKYGLRKLQHEPGVRVTPSHKSFERFKSRSGKLWLSCGLETARWEQDAYRYRWLGGFSLCAADEPFLEHVHTVQAVACTDAFDSGQGQ